MLTSKQKAGAWVWIAAALALCLQWIAIRFLHVEPHGALAPLLPGLAIFGAAFIVSWAAELAQLDMPQAVAFAILALVAVLPEYAVDMYFSWMAAQDPAYHPYPVANMTGANRLLIGMGWSVIIFVYWIKSRERHFHLDFNPRIEIRALLFATVYSFILPIKKSLALYDGVILLSLFGVYIYYAIKSHMSEPELEGPTEAVVSLGKTPRRIVTALFFLLSGFTIFVSAKPFSEGLLEAGRKLGVEEFILVQWLAPLASEAPEFIVAIIFAVRGLCNQSFSTMLSSKINQWTLLVGMIPIVYAVSGKSFAPLYLDDRQVEEIFLTAAQSFFAMAVLSNYIFSIWEALILFVLFISQLFFPWPVVRYIYGSVYLILTLLFLLLSKSQRESMVMMMRKQR
jgi:cation:H+ antiporter